MKTRTKIETYFALIEGIRFENEHGGAYAYVQMLAYNREVIRMLRPIKSAERQIEAIEGSNWLFNEYLAVKFTHRHKVIFENEMEKLRQVFRSVKELLRSFDQVEHLVGRSVHAQAA